MNPICGVIFRLVHLKSRYFLWQWEGVERSFEVIHLLKFWTVWTWLDIISEFMCVLAEINPQLFFVRFYPCKCPGCSSQLHCHGYVCLSLCLSVSDCSGPGTVKGRILKLCWIFMKNEQIQIFSVRLVATKIWQFYNKGTKRTGCKK